MKDDPNLEPGMLEYLTEHVGEGAGDMSMKELFGNMIELLSAGIDTVRNAYDFIPVVCFNSHL